MTEKKKKKRYPTKRVSNSFSREELETLDNALKGRAEFATVRPEHVEVLERLRSKALAGGDVATIVRNPQFRAMLEHLQRPSETTSLKREVTAKIEGMLARAKQLDTTKRPSVDGNSDECDECRGQGFYYIDNEKRDCICTESQDDGQAAE